MESWVSPISGGRGADDTAFSFISKGWREVRDSASADLRLMRARADSLRTLADRELEHLIASASTPLAAPPFAAAGAPIAELEFVRNQIQPKISELRRQYASREPGRVLERWVPPRGATRARVDLSGITAIRNAIVREAGSAERWNGEAEEKEWEVVRIIRGGLQELERRSQSSQLLGGFRGTGELVEKFKSSLKPFNMESDEYKDVTPLYVTEILANLVRQSGPFLDQLGIRRAYLAKSAKQDVTLVVPWLCKSDQELVYPNSMTFSSPEEQETYIRNWLEERLGFESNLKISFYPGKFSKERRSILPAGDTSQFIPSSVADIAILEEPEHLNWYHHGKRWTDKFNHVVGIVHTNYLEYIKREKNGALQAFLVKHINNWVTRAYCDKVLRLSAATQDLPKSIVCNVHGVNPKFLKIGDKLAADVESGQQSFSKGAYFLGKMVWAKGYRELVDLLAKHKSDLEGFKLDVYGSGEDSQEVHSTARKLDLNLNFFKGRDHADDSLHRYKVFINPSISDVLCTATAEALAMGKFVVCAEHPSNEFFMSFPNCLTYRSSDEFVARVKEAMAREPQPLTPEQRYNLSWEAATERFMEYSDLDKVLNDNCAGESRRRTSQPSLSNAVDSGLAFAHRCLTASEVLRLATGAIPGTRDYDEQQRADMGLLPPQVQHPVYGW
ncbi:unnamed protein product [Alopecurus aequalis]